MTTNLIQTKIGLPNTCCECGDEPGSHWFATNDDVARAGGGRCGACAEIVTGAASDGQNVVTNDLAAIRGVGPKRAAEFQALGIQSFEELAQANPEILAVQLNVKLEDVAKWQDQAAELAEAE